MSEESTDGVIDRARVQGREASVLEPVVGMFQRLAGNAGVGKARAAAERARDIDDEVVVTVLNRGAG